MSDAVTAFARAHRVAVVLTFDPNANRGRGAWRCAIDRTHDRPRTWNEPCAIAWGDTPDDAFARASSRAVAQGFATVHEFPVSADDTLRRMEAQQQHDLHRRRGQIKQEVIDALNKPCACGMMSSADCMFNVACVHNGGAGA